MVSLESGCLFEASINDPFHHLESLNNPKKKMNPEKSASILRVLRSHQNIKIRESAEKYHKITI